MPLYSRPVPLTRRQHNTHGLHLIINSRIPSPSIYSSTAPPSPYFGDSDVSTLATSVAPSRMCTPCPRPTHSSVVRNGDERNRVHHPITPRIFIQHSGEETRRPMNRHIRGRSNLAQASYMSAAPSSECMPVYTIYFLACPTNKKLVPHPAVASRDDLPSCPVSL